MTVVYILFLRKTVYDIWPDYHIIQSLYYLYQMDVSLITCLFLLTTSVAYYINTHDSINNITVPNGYHYQIYYQPGFCASRSDTYDPN